MELNEDREETNSYGNLQSELESIVSKQTLEDKLFDDVDAQGINPSEQFADEGPYIKSFLGKLNDTDFIDGLDTGSEYGNFDSDTLIELSKVHVPIEYDESEKVLKFSLLDGSTRTIFDDVEFIEAKRIAEFLPDVGFDVSQGGIKEKAKECEAAYKLIVLNNLVRNSLAKDIAIVISNYDFSTFSPATQEGETFAQLLTRVISNTSPVLRIILTACNKKLSESKTKKEQKIYTELSRLEGQELNDLKIDIAILRNTADKALSKTKIKSERFKILEDLESNIEASIENSNVSEYYIILEVVNVNYIPDSIRQSVGNLAARAANEIKIKEQITGRDSFISDIQRKLKRRAFREYLVSWKKKLIEDYRAGIFKKPRK